MGEAEEQPQGVEAEMQFGHQGLPVITGVPGLVEALMILLQTSSGQLCHGT